MTFKEFVDKYMGIVIGVLIALLIIALGAVYVVECIILIVAFGWLGRYVQNNKNIVKEKLKTFIDKF